jgi:hypothetical protein
LFQASAGIKLTHIPYKGSSPAINDLLGGTVDVMFDYPSIVLPFIQSGKLRALATTGKDRLELLPNVPTIAESGFAMAQASSWSGILVPAGTPPQTVALISKATEEALRDPEVRKSIEPYGSMPMYGLSEAKFGSFIQAEIVKWGCGQEVRRQAGLTIGTSARTSSWGAGKACTPRDVRPWSGHAFQRHGESRQRPVFRLRDPRTRSVTGLRDSLHRIQHREHRQVRIRQPRHQRIGVILRHALG